MGRIGVLEPAHLHTTGLPLIIGYRILQRRQHQKNESKQEPGIAQVELGLDGVGNGLIHYISAYETGLSRHSLTIH